jgi:hypothetical protein
MDKYRAGRSGQPAGYAIVQAAVDARRAGLSRPVRGEELLRLFPLYLRRVNIGLDPPPNCFNKGWPGPNNPSPLKWPW